MHLVRILAGFILQGLGSGWGIKGLDPKPEPVCLVGSIVRLKQSCFNGGFAASPTHKS